MQQDAELVCAEMRDDGSRTKYRPEGGRRLANCSISCFTAKSLANVIQVIDIYMQHAVQRFARRRTWLFAAEQVQRPGIARE